MIAVEESHEKRQAPAETIEELADRLCPLVGRVLKIQRPRAENLYPNTLSAVLDAVWMVDQGLGSTLTIYIDLPLLNNAQQIPLDLSASISLLADGLWSTVHAPKEG